MEGFEVQSSEEVQSLEEVRSLEEGAMRVLRFRGVHTAINRVRWMGCKGGVGVLKLEF
jgi:hypothetical protein